MDFFIRVMKLYIERSDFFLKLIVEHIVLSSVAVFWIALIGVSTGIYISSRKRAADIVLAIVNFVYTIPSIALFGILVSVLGIGIKSALFALVIYGLLPIIRNTYVGIKEVDEFIVESAIGMGSTKGQLLFKIQLPLAMPVIIAGFRTMVIMTIALAGIASFIGAGGLGVAIWRGITTYYAEMTVAGSLLVAFLALISDILIGWVEKLISKRVYATSL